MYLFIYLFREGKGGRERNTDMWLPLTRPSLVIWPATQACALTRNWTSNSSVHRPAPNPLSNTSQGKYYIYPFKYKSEMRQKCSILTVLPESQRNLFFLWREWDKEENSRAGRKGSNLGKGQALRGRRPTRENLSWGIESTRLSCIYLKGRRYMYYRETWQVYEFVKPWNDLCGTSEYLQQFIKT